ncbi:MAG: hypothetical protein M0R80_04085 [Proteobacteria bacterium]|jgi:hypothetical protein|nr:hypothetical protein [Pseudomonadota bacterium]
MSKTYYIVLNQDKVINALADEVFDEVGGQNGYHGIHIHPAVLDAYEHGTLDYPWVTKVTWHQNGNYYPPGSGHISQFGLMDFFNEDALHDSGVMSETLSEVRSDARREWALENNFEFEDVEENFLDEDWRYYEAVQEIIEEWEQTTLDLFREQAAVNRLEEVVDEPESESENQITYIYKIIWE